MDSILWYSVILLAIFAYSALEGFDLGTGMLHPFFKGDHTRRTFLQAIGPLWGGNEVWLVIVFGATFAGFPKVYGTMASACYTPIMLLVLSIILRASSIEFRSKHPSPIWRGTWDLLFSLGSYLMVFTLCLILGNLLQGLPLNENQEFMGSIPFFFRRLPLTFVLLGFSFALLQGSLFLTLKTEAPIQKKIKKGRVPFLILFLIFLGMTLIYTSLDAPHLMTKLFSPLSFIAMALFLVSLIFLSVSIAISRDGLAFLFSSLLLASVVIFFGYGSFPYLIYSLISPESRSLTISEGASSISFKSLFSILAIGVPLVLFYTFWVYRLFKGKVQVDEDHY